MCLYVDVKSTASLLERGPTIRAWKVLRREYHRGHHRLISAMMCFIWNPGENISDSRNKKPRKRVDAVGRGIHVFLSHRQASSWVKQTTTAHERVVLVTCHVKDLVAADEWGRAVFTKVHLSKRAYNKAMKP